MDLISSVEMVGWLYPVGSGQWLHVLMDVGDKWCLSRVHIGTNTFSIFINGMDICKWHQAEWYSWPAWRKGCHSEAPGQAWGMAHGTSRCWPRLSAGAAPGPGQLLVPTLGGGWRHSEQPYREGGAGGLKGWHKAVMWTHSPASQPPLGLHQKQRGQQVKRGNSASAPLWYNSKWTTASSSGVLSTEKTWTFWNGSKFIPPAFLCSREGPRKGSGVWITSPMRTGWHCYGWFPCRREGSKETLLCHFNTGVFIFGGILNFLPSSCYSAVFYI